MGVNGVRVESSEHCEKNQVYGLGLSSLACDPIIIMNRPQPRWNHVNRFPDLILEVPTFP